MSVDTTAVASSSSMEGWAQIRYAKMFAESVPDVNILRDLIKFEKGEKLGDHYEQPIELTTECGITLADGLGTQMTALKEPVLAKYQSAKLYDVEFTARTYVLTSWLAKNAEGSPTYGNLVDRKVMNMRNGLARFIETMMIDGQEGMGSIYSSSDATTGYLVFTLTNRTWSRFKWEGLEGARLMIYSTAGSLITGTGGTGELTISAVSRTAKTLKVTGTAGDMAAIQSAIAAQSTSYHLIYPSGFKALEFAGLRKIASNTGTLYDIDGTSWSAWQGQTHTLATGETLTKDVAFAALAKAYNPSGGEQTMIIPYCGFASLLSSLSALQDAQGGKGDVKVGSRTIEFFGPTGPVKAVAHPFMGDGYGVIIPSKKAKMIGATDITFGVPGAKGEKDGLMNVPGYNAREMQCHAQLALYLPAPSECVLIVSNTVSTTL